MCPFSFSACGGVPCICPREQDKPYCDEICPNYDCEGEGGICQVVGYDDVSFLLKNTYYTIKLMIKNIQ